MMKIKRNGKTWARMLPAFGIIALGCALCLAARQRQEDTLSDRQKASQADALFRGFNSSTPGCAVAVVKDDHIVYAGAYGMANLELGVPITKDSVFGIDSMSKQFTGMSIALLALRGKLSLQDAFRDTTRDTTRTRRTTLFMTQTHT